MTYDSTHETLEHVRKVQVLLLQVIEALIHRSYLHDASKLDSPEKEIFDEFTPKLKNTTFGSDEYTRYLNEMGVALQHHYEFNSHHPEHFKNGIAGMSLLDLVEMLSDWYAASLRHPGGDMRSSLKMCRERFGIGDQLYQIFLNTLQDLGWD
jgi:hypothetical protein